MPILDPKISKTPYLCAKIDNSMDIFKQFTFDSAHYLPYVPEEHKCRRMHGHTYIVRLYVTGDLHPKLGWVADFGEIKALWKPIEDQLDHHTLNTIEGLENPTAENLAIWIWKQVKPQLSMLSRVDVCENATSGVVYKGEYE